MTTVERTSPVDAPIEPDVADTMAEDSQPSPEEALADRLFGTLLDGLDLFTIYLGDALGLYGSIAEQPATSAELAERCGVDERYAREWLEQQAVTGFLEVDGYDGDDRRYRLAPGVENVLVDETSPTYLAAIGRMGAAVAQVLPDLVTAYRSGAGVPWSAYGPDAVVGQAAFNRPAYLHELVQTWLPAVPEIHARLQDQTRPARVVDVACGGGWSSIAMAKAFPWIRVEGFDLDEASVLLARRNAAEQGVADRVEFAVCGPQGPRLSGSYDVAFIFEAVHDMSRPVDVLRSIRAGLAPDAHLLVVDQQAAEEFTAANDPVQRLLYGASVLVCLPTGRADEVSAATGALMRPDTLRRFASDAGFASVSIVPVEHPLFRFYDLVA